MGTRVDLGQLKTGEWERLQDITDQFERAWLSKSDLSETVDLGAFLPAPDDSLRPVALIELITTDLEIRWRRGQVISLDSYLEKYPELGTLRTVATKLIYEEYRVRQLHGDRPGLGLYRSRFPAQYAELEQMVRDNPVETLTLPSQQKTPTRTPTPSAATAPPSSSTNQMMTTTHPMTELGGGYLFVKRIGSGSYGEVWRAEAPGGVEVAVKMITRPIEQAEAQQEKQALDLMKNLRHPYLVQTHQSQVLEDRLFIVMELADTSLRDRLKECLQEGKPGIPVPELLRYMREAAEALDFLHTENVHHRDIKPENILLLKKHAKVADFGLSRWLDCQRDLATATATGTPAYMAPEVWKGLISPHSDQYSLAVTYFELRLGRRLYQSKAMIDLMRCHTEDLPDLGAIPPAEQAVLMKALAKEPEQRYASCLEFVEALQEAVAPPPPSLSSTMIPVVEVSPRRRRLKAAAYALTALLPIVLLTVFGKSLFFPGSFSVEVPTEEVLLTPGTTRTITLPVHREHFRGPVQLHFSGMPNGVNLVDTEAAADADSAEVTFEVSHEAPTGPAWVLVRAEAGDVHTEARLDLHVLFLPAGFEKAGDEVVTDDNGRKFYRRIDRVFADGTRVEFVLIPKKRDTLLPNKPNLETFYIMRDKVWLGLFQKFARENPNLVKNRSWEALIQPGRERYPAFDVSVSDTLNFARKWFEGTVPTTDQWDKAIGTFDKDRGTGPFVDWSHPTPDLVASLWGGLLSVPPYLGDWLPPLPDIAVYGRSGPLEIGKARHDRSPSGCRDVAGNGQEWTRSLADGGLLPLDTAPRPSAILWVKLRGRSFDAPGPFHYRFLETASEVDKGIYRFHETKPDIGFRVVIEP